MPQISSMVVILKLNRFKTSSQKVEIMKQDGQLVLQKKQSLLLNSFFHLLECIVSYISKHVIPDRLNGGGVAITKAYSDIANDINDIKNTRSNIGKKFSAIFKWLCDLKKQTSNPKCLMVQKRKSRETIQRLLVLNLIAGEYFLLHLLIS